MRIKEILGGRLTIRKDKGNTCIIVYIYIYMYFLKFILVVNVYETSFIFLISVDLTYAP